MGYDTAFVNGVVKSRERFLLGSKISRLIESSGDEIFKTLKDVGFGSSSAAESFDEIDAMLFSEEGSVNAFVKEHAPDQRPERFLLADCDFNNLEALVKEEFTGCDPSPLLSPEGSFKIDKLKALVKGEDGELPSEMIEAVKEASALFKSGAANGFNVDCTFKRWLFRYLKANAKGKALGQILCSRADRANVSAALRSGGDGMDEMFVEGGKLPISHVIAISKMSKEEISASGEEKYIKQAVLQHLNGEPIREFEKSADDFPLELLDKTKYDMLGSEPFLRYVFKRRAEIRNVRIIAVCVKAGISPVRIRERLRII